MATEDFIATAEWIARQAHAGQHDKVGVDYIEHPALVAHRVRQYSETPQAAAAAWLHDVIEDTPVTAEDLREAGLPDDVIIAVELLTKREGQSLEDYCAGVRENPIALAVKQADVDDNTDPARTAQLPGETRERLAAKYARTRQLLGVTARRSTPGMRCETSREPPAICSAD